MSNALDCDVGGQVGLDSIQYRFVETSSRYAAAFAYLKRTPTITLDTDWLWRVAGPAAAHVFAEALRSTRAALNENPYGIQRRTTDWILRHRTQDGFLLRSWPTGSMSLWVMVMLMAYLAIYYLG